MSADVRTAIDEMNRSVGALGFEVPHDIHRDVRQKWAAVRTSVTARLRLVLADAESLTETTGSARASRAASEMRQLIEALEAPR